MHIVWTLEYLCQSYLRLDVCLEVLTGLKIHPVYIVWSVCVLTIAPQLQALLLVSEAHAVIAVGVTVLAWGSIQEVNVGGAVGWSTRAVLWEVTWASCTTAHRTCLFQLRAQRKRGHVGIHISTFVCIVHLEADWGLYAWQKWQLKKSVKGEYRNE